MFIIWNPNATEPPQKKFETFEQAYAVLESMAEKHPEATFYLCELAIVRADGVADWLVDPREEWNVDDAWIDEEEEEEG